MVNVKLDKKWSFKDLTRRETNYATHGYHSYPAKFIPQLASKLVKDYSKKGQTVCDPFGGCGTTMVECKILERNFWGIDINPVAVLISKAKKDPIKEKLILKELEVLERNMSLFKNKNLKNIKEERILYWFKIENINKLDYLLKNIDKIKSKKIRLFFKCAFSNILKSSSQWLQKSNKPTKDNNKSVNDPFILFIKQIKRMLKMNNEFQYHLSKKKKTDIKIKKGDATNLKIKSNKVDLIVTSPPYVTSYDYADLHQLSLLWLFNTKKIKNNFIGTLSKREKMEVNIDSLIYKNLLNKISYKSPILKDRLENYFNDMYLSFTEMKRSLKNNAHACIVIGDTKIMGINIYNSKIFIDLLKGLDFKIKKIIKRKIDSKNLPSLRDAKTGRFANKNTKQKINIYKYEYIIIAQLLKK